MNKETININGLNISYYVEGEGENLIFLHGWGQNIESFAPVINILKQDYRIWAIDFPGHGQSQEPEEGLSIYQFEEILTKFIAEKEIKNPSLVGHSFGGRVAIIYSSKNENINKLILTGAAGIVPKKSLSFKFKVAHYKFMKALTLTPFYKQYRDDLLNNSGSADYKNASPVMKACLTKTVNEDLQYLMPQISAKTLLYWGENDEATPLEDGNRMNEIIPNSKLKVMPSSGHYAYLENYNDFIKEIVNFLKH